MKTRVLKDPDLAKILEKDAFSVDPMNIEPVTIEPMHNRVLVERLPREPQEYGRIIIPDKYQEVTIFCKVIAVGPGRWEDGVFTKTAVKPGDVVLVPGVGNKYPDWQDGEQILITDQDIGAIVG